MIQRMEPAPAKDEVLISQEEFKSDLERGYAILLYREAGELVIRNPRMPGSPIRRPQGQILKYCCMQCKFDSVEGDYPAAQRESALRTGLDIMREHVFRGNHPWVYRPYETPYGMLGDVRIEGIEDYVKYLKEISE